MQPVPEHQFGFRQLHSTTTALLDSTNSLYVNMDRKLFNLVVLLDLKIAFDTVNHYILLCKLELYGITGNPLSVIQSCLSDRKQKCQLGNVMSSELHVKCGIPKGVDSWSPLIPYIHKWLTGMSQLFRNVSVIPLRVMILLLFFIYLFFINSHSLKSIK